MLGLSTSSAHPHQSVPSPPSLRARSSRAPTHSQQLQELRRRGRRRRCGLLGSGTSRRLFTQLTIGGLDLGGAEAYPLFESIVNGIEGRVREIRPGPVCTTYEFVPAPGIKVSKIAALACESPSKLGLPLSHWTPGELSRQAKKLGIADGFIRLSVGIEEADDILWDIDQALRKAVA